VKVPPVELDGSRRKALVPVPPQGEEGKQSRDEPAGLNEDEPQRMSLDKIIRSRRVTGVMTKADVCGADNRQPPQSPAGSAWQARWEGKPDKLGGLRS
jgi:hypothetical protein